MLLVLAAIPATPSRTLFIGNSYTYYNGGVDGLYSSVVNAARASSLLNAKSLEGSFNPDFVEAHAVAKPNFFLRQHAADHCFPKGPWENVVLQEQSQAPGLPEDNAENAASKDAVQQLTREAIAQGALTLVLMQTWGRRDGDNEHASIFPTFEAMQTRLTAGYQALAEVSAQEVLGARGLQVRVAPCGEAFRAVKATDETLFRALYSEDGAHPSLAGSYLAACVLAGTLHPGPGSPAVTRGTSDGILFAPPELNDGDAAALRAAACSVL